MRRRAEILETIELPTYLLPCVPTARAHDIGHLEPHYQPFRPLEAFSRIYM